MNSTGTEARSRAPRWFVTVLTVLTTLVVLCGVALAWQIAVDGAFGTRIALWILLAVLGAFSLPLGLTGILRKQAFWLSASGPIAIVLLCAVVQFQIPESVGWQLSRGILEEQSTECTDPGGTTRLGAYSITAVTKRDGGCLFAVQGGGTPHGFAYFPNGTPPKARASAGGATSYEPYRDEHWYRFTE